MHEEIVARTQEQVRDDSERSNCHLFLTLQRQLTTVNVSRHDEYMRGCPLTLTHLQEVAGQSAQSAPEGLVRARSH